jgi:outer membrane protein OmpA-like peptidoglycan-associated protein
VSRIVSIRTLTRAAGALAVAGVVSTGSVAQAEPGPHPDAFNASVDANPFRPDIGGHGVTSTGSADILPHMDIAGQVIFHQLSRPLVVVDDFDATMLRSLVGNRQQMDLSGVIGFLDRFEAGLTLPIVMHQLGEYAGQKLEAPPSAGIGNTVLHLKGQILAPSSAPVGLALSMPVTLPTGNSNAYMGYRGLGVEPRLTASRRMGAVRGAGSIGYLVQPKTELFNVIDDDKLTYRFATAFSPTKESWEVALEYAGAARAGALFASPDETTGELIAAGMYQYRNKFNFFGGVGTGVQAGIGTPAYRMYVGVAYQGVSNPDLDRDGIPIAVDVCPNDPEDLDGFEDADGCPDTDNDKDNIADVDDGCPDEPEDEDGYLDEDGCPEWDNDGDGFADSEDQCPLEGEDYDTYLDGDGCADPDNDGDGVVDDNDQCPDEAEDADRFQDDDGCPDNDNDQDTFVDAVDECPNRPEDFNDISDDDGCPDASLIRVTREAIVINDVIRFMTTRATLLPESFPILNQVAKVLVDHPEILKVEVGGHADSEGTDDHNLKLSRERSKSVRYYLVDRGVSEDRLSARGYGETNPIDTNRTDTGRASNRRVEFRIVESELSDEFFKQQDAPAGPERLKPKEPAYKTPTQKDPPKDMDTEGAGMELPEDAAATATADAAAGETGVRIGTLKVTLKGGGWAYVYIDGQKLSRSAPFDDVDVPVGPHEVWIASHKLGLDYTVAVDIRPGETTTLAVDPEVIKAEKAKKEAAGDPWKEPAEGE